jgi:HNH endonuclease
LVKDCRNRAKARGRCGKHWDQWRKAADPAQFKMRKSCQVLGCERPSIARHFCTMHYQRWKKHGDPGGTQSSVGNGYFDKNGYRYISAGGKAILEHRYVMEQHLGRPLLPSENVHHRDGNKARNDVGNLELWIMHQPKGQRARDLLAWAREIIARYEPVEDKL